MECFGDILCQSMVITCVCVVPDVREREARFVLCNFLECTFLKKSTKVNN